MIPALSVMCVTVANCIIKMICLGVCHGQNQIANRFT